MAVSAVVCLAFWPALFHVARADHLSFFMESAPYDSWGAMVRDFHSFNRVRSFDRGDVVLFRPLMFTLMCTEARMFGWNFFWWQAAGIALHLAAVYALLRLLWALHRGWFAVLLSLWFATLFIAQSTVTWQHVNGYVLYVVLLLWALYHAFRHVEEGQRHAWRLWAIAGLALAGGLTYEAGNALGPVLAVYLWCARPRDTKSVNARWLLLLLAPLVLYCAWDAADFWWIHPTPREIHTAGTGDMIGSFSLLATLRAVVVIPAMHLYGALAPALQQPGYGTDLLMRPTTWDMARSLSWSHALLAWLSVAATAACVLTACWLTTMRARRMPRAAVRRESRPDAGFAAVALALMLAQVLLVAIGRANTRGLMTYVLANSTYYAYMEMPLVIVAGYACCRAVGFGLIAQAAGPRVRVMLALVLAGVAAINAGMVFLVNDHVRSQYPARPGVALRHVEPEDLASCYQCGTDREYRSLMTGLGYSYLKYGMRCAVRFNRPEVGRRKLTTAVTVSSFTTNFAWAVRLNERGQPDRALELFDDPATAKGMNRQIVQMEYDRACRGALDIYSAEIARDSTNAALYHARANVYFRLRDYPRARADAERAIKLGGQVNAVLREMLDSAATQPLR